MSIKFYPRLGQLFMCDFSDINEPEMNKIRPVVVISPRLPYRSQIVTIVPISTTRPFHDLPFCFRLSKNYHPAEDANLPCWAKADMVGNFSVSRLDGFKVGRRKWEIPEMSDADLEGVRGAVLAGLGFLR